VNQSLPVGVDNSQTNSIGLFTCRYHALDLFGDHYIVYGLLSCNRLHCAQKRVQLIHLNAVVIEFHYEGFAFLADAIDLGGGDGWGVYPDDTGRDRGGECDECGGGWSGFILSLVLWRTRTYISICFSMFYRAGFVMLRHFFI